MCLRLLLHFILAAASRIFWTAGSKSPISIAMIAMTTNSSMSVKPRCLVMETTPVGKGQAGPAGAALRTGGGRRGGVGQRRGRLVLVPPGGVAGVGRRPLPLASPPPQQAALAEVTDLRNLTP